MLVLDRTKDQAILIGDNITIKILKTVRGHAKVGIDAPKDMRILRQELVADTVHTKFDVKHSING